MSEPTVGDAAKDSPGVDRRRWVLVALVAGFVVQLAWRIWLIRHATTPIAHADEDRYLLSARALAGGPGGLGGDTSAFRRMGYPLFLAPIYAYTSDPFRVYHAAQILGASVNALAFPLAYLFGRRVLHAGRWLALAVAFVAVSLPALVFYSEFTLTDVLFGPLGLLWLLLVHGWFAGRTGRGRAAAGIGAGVVVGYAAMVHVRGLVMLGVFVAVLALAVFRERGRWKAAAVGAVAALAVASVDLAVQRMVADRMAHGGVEPGTRLISRVTEAGAFVQTLCDAAGQFWYTVAGTWGLGAVGLVVAVDRIRNRGGEKADWPQRLTLGVAVIVAAAIAVSSAAALPADMRVSNHAYFRYVAWLAPVWVLVAGVALIGAGRRTALRLVGRGSALTIAALCLVLTQMRYFEAFEPFDTPEVSFLTRSWQHFLPARASVTVLGILLVLALALGSTRGGFRRAWAAALVGVLALNTTAMIVVNDRLVGPMARAQYGTGPRLVRDLKVTENDVVASSEWVALGGRLNHQCEVYWAPVLYFDHRVGERPPAAATVVVGPWHSRNKDDYDGEPDGWHRVAGNPKQEYAVWLRAGDPRLDGTVSLGNGS